MADQVQRLLEDMVPELEDFQKKRLFSKAEVKSIVAKRTAFEYSLLRRQHGDRSGVAGGALTSTKTDYLRYIEFELNVDQLRIKRKNRIGLIKTSISDFSIARHIHFLYDRMMRKFSDDLSLWLQWISYSLKTESNRTLAKIFPRVLQLHPTCGEMWARAALWEFTANSNIDAARVLFQRGIRMNPSDAELWLQFYELELMFVAKLAKRKAVLGLTPAAAEAAKLKAEAEAKARAAAVGSDVLSLASTDLQPESKAGAKSHKASDEDLSAYSKAEKQLLACIIPRTIFRNAISGANGSGLDRDWAFRMAFIDRLPEPVRHAAGVASIDRPKKKKKTLSASAAAALIDYSGLLHDIESSVERDFARVPAVVTDRAQRAVKRIVYQFKKQNNRAPEAAASKSTDTLTQFQTIETGAWAVFEAALTTDPATAATDGSNDLASRAGLWAQYAQFAYDRLLSYAKRADDAKASAAVAADDAATAAKKPKSSKLFGASAGVYHSMVEYCTIRCVSICERAEAVHCMSESLITLWVKLLLHVGESTASVAKLDDALSLYPSSVALWRLRLHIQTKSFLFVSAASPSAVAVASSSSASASATASSLDRKHSHSAHKSVSNASTSAAGSNGATAAAASNKQPPLQWKGLLAAYATALDSVPLNAESWVIVTEWIQIVLSRCGATDRDACDAVFRSVLTNLQCRNSIAERTAQHAFLLRVKAAYVQWASTLALASDRAHFRSAADYVLSFAPFDHSLLQLILQFESATAPDATRIRSLYERAITSFGATSTAVWFEFMAFETRSGQFQRSNALYTRALKTLSEPHRTDFIRQHANGQQRT